MKLFIFLVLVLLISLLITYIGDVIKKSKEPIVLNFKKWVCPISAYPNWHRVIQNGYTIKMADTGITLPTNRFSISFIYKLTGLNNTWNNIVFITNTNSNDHRCPGIWVRPNETNLHLHHVPSNIESIEGVPLNTEAFFTFLFNYNNIEVYINGVKRSFNFNNGGTLNEISPTAIMYIGDPFHGTNGTINVQDFTIYDGVLTPDQINTIYSESTKEGREKKIKDDLEAELKSADEQRTAQRKVEATSTLTKLNSQLNATPTNNVNEIANIKNRIAQYQSIS
jgi:hypothetical protein